MHVVSSITKAKLIRRELGNEAYTIVKHPYKSRLYCVCKNDVPINTAIYAMNGGQ